MSATATATPIAQVISWAIDQTWSEFAQDIAYQFHTKGLTPNQENAIRGMYEKCLAKAQAKAQAPAPVAPVTEPGMYRQDGVVYRVRVSKGSGNLYAMRYVPEGADEKARFEYVRGMVYRLSATDRLSLDEAKALGHEYGQCCVCGAELKDPKSVEAGIGPVCAKRV